MSSSRTKKSAARRRSPRRSSVWRRIPKAWKISVTIAVGVAAIGGAITVIPPAYKILEPHLYATHAHVDERIEPVDQKTNVLIYSTLAEKKNTAKRDEGGWSVQLQKEKDQAARDLIQKQIDHARDDQRRYEARMNQLSVPDWAK